LTETRGEVEDGSAGSVEEEVYSGGMESKDSGKSISDVDCEIKPVAAGGKKTLNLIMFANLHVTRNDRTHTGTKRGSHEIGRIPQVP
jgi:hypothetical protein